MKVLISADMEGISGVVEWKHVTPGHSEHERFRKLMTGDVNAAVAGAFEGGATEVVVTDSHWYGTNILLEELDERVRLNSGLDSPFDMLQGIDRGVSCLVLVGYHGSCGARDAVLDHTWNYVRVRSVSINEQRFGEIALSAARAGSFGVPLVAITGDQTACREATDLVGSELATAVVKYSHGQTSSECLPLVQSRAAIHAAAKTGVGRAKSGSCPAPLKVTEPLLLEVDFTTTVGADRASILPGSERVDGTKVQYRASDIVTAFRAFRSLVSMSCD